MLADRIEFNIKRTGDVGASGINNLSNSLGRLQKASDKAVKHTSKLLDSLKRIAMYRMLRTIIKEIGQAFSEGLKNVYQYSSTINGALSQTLDSLASITTQFKNSLGSALGELLISIEPVLTAIINMAVRVADAIARLFAVLGGRSTYSKAVESAKKWEDAAKGGAAAAKEWRNQLMGFDEINRLNDQSSGGGGGAYDGKFEEAPASHAWAEELRRITMDWWNGLNLEPIINAWDRLREAVSWFVEIVDNGLRWAYENVLLPLAGWVIQEAAPALVNLLAIAFDFLNAVIEKLSPAFKSMWDNILKPLLKWIGEKFIIVVNRLTDVFADLWQKLEESDDFLEFLRSLDGKELIVLALATSFLLLALNISPIKLLILGIIAVGAALVENWDKIKEAASNLWDKLQPVRDAFSTVRDTVAGAVEKVKEFWAWLTGASYSPGYTTSAGRFVGNGNSITRYASGGYPNEGQLFWARENGGAELVGQIGGRTAVANNDQIVASVSDGVYRAVTEALLTHGGNGNSSPEIVVQIDGNTIARTTTKYQKFNTIAANA